MTADLDLDPVVVVDIGEPGRSNEARPMGRRAIRRAREEQRRRRRRRYIGAGVGLVWLSLLAFSFFGAISASRRADEAITRLTAQGLASTEAGDLRALTGDLEAARSRLTDPWVRPLEFVPILGRQIRAAKTIDESALEAIEAGAEAIEVLDRARESSDQTELLQLARTELQTARARLATTVLPSTTLLIPPLVDARNRLGDHLVEIDRELERFQAMADAFGSLVETDATYLLAAANTSEMGAGTGMLLSMGLLEIVDGGVVVGDLESVGQLGRASGVEIPEEIRDRWFSLDPGHLFQYTALLTPRAEEVGRITADMWESVEDSTVDGVLIVNPVALQILLQTSGRDTVDIDGEIYPIDVIGRFFGRLQYQLYPDSTERRELLAPVAQEAFGAVFDDVADPQRLVDAIYEAVEGRHLMAWSRDPDQQARWERLGMSGSLQSDSVLISILNAGGNKLDAFIEIDAEMTWIHDDSGTQVTVQIDVTNTATGGEVGYVAGGGRRTAEAGEYVGYLTVNVPAGATRAEMDGTTATNAAGSDGPTHQLVHILELDPGQRAAYQLEFDLPAVFDRLTLEPSGRLPGIEWIVNAEPVPDRRQVLLLG